MMYFTRSTKSAAFAAALGFLGYACTTEDQDVSYEDGTASAAGSSGSTSSTNSSSSAAGSGGSGGSGGGASTTTTTTGTSSSTGTTSVVTTGSGDVNSLTFDVTTTSQGGKYAPKNVGAIWIENSSGAYVRSLEVWAGIRKRDLRLYVAALGGQSDTDVVSSATLTKHIAHEVTWDLKDYSGNAVTPGKYTLFVEVTDRDGAGQSYSIDFDTSAGTQVITPANATYYSSMSLTLE